MWDEQVWQTLGHNVVLFLPRLATGLVVFFVFWLAARGLRRVVERLTRVRHFDPNLTHFLGQIVGVSLLVIGGVSALGTMGVDVSALVAGLGLTGFALGFALKDIISNSLSGILVMIYRPFRVHDRISVTDLEGTVIEINMRYTVLDAEDKTILVPNSSLMTNAVKILKPVVPAASSPQPPQPPQPPAIG
jgi:small-conductance mechanosensitive channel